MYGNTAFQLVKDFDRSDPGQLTHFNHVMFDEAVKECNTVHFHELVNLMRSMESGLEDQSEAVTCGMRLHNNCIIRNKCCLLSYMYNRSEILRNLRWEMGKVIPKHIQDKMSFYEEEYFKNHSEALESYMCDMGIDLFVDLVPPKESNISVRVLEDIGEVLVGDQSILLSLNSMHFLNSADVEHYILRGQMEELQD